MHDARNGQKLYDDVQTYAALGQHRTGTEVDRMTADWMAGRLRDLGLGVTIEPVGFDRWIADATLTADGVPIACLPVPYSWTGSFDSAADSATQIAVASLDPASGGFPFVLDEPVAKAVAAGATAVVLCTAHPDGSLVGVNRVLGDPGFDVPVLLTGGSSLSALTSGNVELRIDARVEPGTTYNVIATTMATSTNEPLLLTTPLTGWFGCAGERGTGIAVLLDLVDQFSDTPLLVVATGGHELGHFGAQRWVDANAVPVRATVHVGASVAVEQSAEDGTRGLLSARMAMTSLDEQAGAPVAAALANAGLTLATSTTNWIGEGQAFCQLDAPLLSVTGAGVDFHTPGDTPERVTSPDSLQRVARSFGAAISAMLNATEDQQ